MTFVLRKHVENLPKPSLCSASGGKAAKASKKVTLQKNTGTKLLDSADMTWFGLLHIISEELATATFMETNQKELRCPKWLYSKRSPDRNATIKI